MSVKVVNSGSGVINITAETIPTIKVSSPTVSVVDINPVVTGSTIGPTGAQGPAGSDGQGVPTGGSQFQILRKVSGTDYDTQWDYADRLTIEVRFDEAVSKGDPLYITGFNIGQNRVAVAKADAADPDKMPCIGLAFDDYSQNDNGQVTTIGSLDDVNTQVAPHDFQEGDVLYVKAGGGLTNVKPTGTNLIQNVGKVGRRQQNNGEIVVMAIGRSNDVPNIADGKIWIGNGSGVATPTTLNAAAIPDFDTEVSNNSSVAANTVKETNVTTNLGLTQSSVNVTVTSSDGTNATIPPVSTTLAGVMTAAEHVKLARINASADVTNSSSVEAAGAIMDTDFTSNGLMERTGNGSYTTVPKSTSSIPEGTNLYYTDAKVTTLLGNTNVSALANGSSVILTTTEDVSGTSFVLAENNLATNSTTKVPTQASVKAYVDSQLSPALIDNNGSVDVPTGITQAELRTAIGVDAAGTDNSTNVTLANTNYLSLSGQTLTGGTVPIGSGGTGATDAAGARANLDLQDNDIRNKFSAGTGISYNSTTGEISSTVSDTVRTVKTTDGATTTTLESSEDLNLTAGTNIGITENAGVVTIATEGVLTSVSGDGAPTLGGNLDASGNNIVEVEEIGLRDKIYHDDDTDTYIQFNGNDSFKVVTGNIDKLSATSNKVEINPAQANVDLQVNGDTANNVLYVDASANKVGILTSSPSSALHVSGDIRVSGNVLVDGTGTVDGEDVSTLVSYNDFTGGTGIGFSSGTISVNEHTTIETAAAAPNATITVTGPSGQADSITLAAGSNITLTEAGDQITIASTASGGASALDDLSDVTISGSVAGNQYLVHNGNSDFVNQALDISHDTDPDLGGDLDVGDHSIVTSTGNKDITLNPDGTGRVNLGTYPIKADDSLVSGDNLKVLTYVHSATAGASEIRLVSNPQGTVTVSGTPSSTQIAAFAADTSQIAGHTGFEFDGSGFTTPNVLVEEGTLSAAGRYGSGARVTKTMFTDLNANKVAGDIYVMKTNNTNWTTRSNATTEADSSGLLAVAASTNSGAGMVLSGIVRMADNTGFASAAPGSTLYLDTVDGHATITKPTGQGKVVRIIGYVVDNGGNAGSNDGVIYFDPSKDYITLSQ